MSPIVLPYEPQYTGRREAVERRRATKAWLRKREEECFREAPIAPDHEPESQ